MIQSNFQSISSNQSRFKIVIFLKTSRAKKFQTRRYHLQGTGVKFWGKGITLYSYIPKTMVIVSRSQGCILSLAGAATSIIFVATNTSFVMTKSILVATKLLS